MLIKDPPVEISDGLWMLGTNEYPVFLVSSGGEAAVFEGGVGALGTVVECQLAGTGVAAEAVKRIIVTHAHPDHVMAVPAFRALFGEATVCASKAATATLQVEKAVRFFGKIDGMLTEALIKAGSVDDSHRPQPLAEHQIAVDRVLVEGDVVDVGDMKFAVLETPGHSDCSLSFHEGDAGVLIISDATGYYIPDCEYYWPNYFSSYGAYLESVRRLGALGAEVLCLSHNAVIKGCDAVKAYLDGAIAATEAYHDRIVTAAEAGKGADEIAAELGAEVYEKTQLLPVEFFQKNSAILVQQSMKHVSGE